MYAILLKVSVIIAGVVAVFYLNLPLPWSHKENLAPVSRVTTETSRETEKVSAQPSTTASETNTESENTLTNKDTGETLGLTKGVQISSATAMPEQKILIPLDILNNQIRPAIVNIFCTTKTGGDFRPISGSGVIISKNGIILTNAHVAQYLLLKNYAVENFMNCIARTGSPARQAYKIDLLYLPPNWLTENAKMIKQEDPESTGENDYALLLVTDSATDQPLPSSFSFIDTDIDQTHITADVPVLLGGYPANFLGGIEAERDLWITTSPADITKLYYFNEKDNVDAFSVGSNIVAQKGVSGGAAINQQSGKVAGILTTISGGETTDSRDLAAITMAHIDRSLQKNTGENLNSFLGGDIQASLYNFKQNSLPGLIKTLTDALDSTKAN